MYAQNGRPSIPPERLLKASLLIRALLDPRPAPPAPQTSDPPPTDTNSYALTADGIRVAIFYTKVYGRLLRPL